MLSNALFADTCQINNGGCDGNALCSHDATTNACKCTCKTGYTNTGSSSNVICTGKLKKKVAQTAVNLDYT